MMSLTSLSQDIPIKKSALISMLKESKVCDSLRVAYNKKTIVLNGLIDTNLIMFDQIEKQRKEQKTMQKEIDKVNLQNQKLAKKKKNTKTYILSSAAGGLIVGVLLAK